MCLNTVSAIDDVVIVLAAVNDGKLTFACACSKAAIAKGLKAGNIIREVAKIAGGNGGGKPDIAMAGGKDITKADEALYAVKGIVEAAL
jgi:alanyl-tRNA synthetase